MAFIIRDAKPEDIEVIDSFIKELAAYEELSHEVNYDMSMLSAHLFDNKSASCILAFHENMPVGFAVYFYHFSTFLAQQSLYLEDLYVKPAYRNKGLGKKMLQKLAHIAHQKQCGRMEWSVLNWNTPAIEFYNSIGAFPMQEWTVYRLDKNAIENFMNMSI